MGCSGSKQAEVITPPISQPQSPSDYNNYKPYTPPQKSTSGDVEGLKPDGSCVIAIDFGTSRSAFAYGFVGGAVSVTLGVPTNSVLAENLQLKAETSLVLDESMKAIAFGLKGRRDTYSKLINKKKMFLFQWFKMHLKDITNDADETLTVMDHKGHPVPLITVISEALNFIAQSALDEVNRVANKRYQLTDIYWVITVPAIWSSAASGFMRRAALRAKMIPYQLSQKLTLVREPEAACVDLLFDIDQKNTPIQLKDGSELLILDCGGGTNDMTFVKILQKEPLRCQEVKEAAGGAAGAASIDNHLKKLMEELFERERYEKMKVLPAMIDILDSWEQFKVSFEGEGTFDLNLSNITEDYQDAHPDDIINKDVITRLVEDYNSSKPSSEHIENKRIRLFIPNKLLIKWFDSVVDLIIRDLNTQLRHKSCGGISILYLVGGFCANRYLVNKMTKFIKENHRKIEIIQAKHPDVAIVRGAVVSSLRSTRPLIEDHVASYAYGLSASATFDKNIHDFSKSFMAGDGQRRVNVFILFVRKGAHVPIDYTTPDKNFFPITAKQINLSLEMYTVDDERVDEKSVVYIDDPRVKKMVSLIVPMNMNTKYEDRKLSVAIKFGMETQIVAKDINAKTYQDTQCVFYA